MLSKVLWSFGHSYRLSKGCFRPNPAVRSSIAGCQVEKPWAATTGRYRPKPDVPQSGGSGCDFCTIAFAIDCKI
jgi:hypothetical protein